MKSSKQKKQLKILCRRLNRERNRRREVEKRCADRIHFETLLNEISAGFVNLPVNRIDAAIEAAQRRICECLDLDLSALWQWSGSSPHYMTVTRLHSPPEDPEIPKGIDAGEAFPWVLERLLRDEVVVLPTLKIPPEAARDEESRRHFGDRSSVAIPLRTGGEPIIGILNFDTMKSERSWEPSVVKKLCLLAEIFTNALFRKRSEPKLLESRMRLSIATESAGVGLWVMESASGALWVTPQTRELFQLSKHGALDYDNLQQKIDPMDREHVDKAAKAALLSGEKLEIEFAILHPEEGPRWIKANDKSLPDNHSNGVRLMGAFIDISSHKQVEKQLSLRIQEIEHLTQRVERENLYLREKIERNSVHKKSSLAVA